MMSQINEYNGAESTGRATPPEVVSVGPYDRTTETLTLQVECSIEQMRKIAALLYTYVDIEPMKTQAVAA